LGATNINAIPYPENTDAVANGALAIKNVAIAVDPLVSPTGAVISFAGATAPAGWLLCNGTTVSRTTYAKLFTLIGTTYNTGGEAGTDFRLPNLLGRVPVGRDASQTEFDTLGERGGAKTHTLTAAEQANMNVYYGSPNPADNYRVGAGGALGGYVGPGVSSINNGFGTLTAMGGNGAHNNLQPYIALNYIIKT
jgi:microcystin-dependent protein